MNKKRTISVIIPTYNRKSTLKRAIESVLNQTYQPLEIIIIDDASTDGTFEYIQELYGDLEYLIYIVNKENMGQSASRNVGVSSAKGEFVAFLDSDDEWRTDKLEKQMNAIEEAKDENVLCYSASIWEWENGMQGHWPPREWKKEQISGNVFSFLLLHPLVGKMTILMSRKLFLDVGGFNEDLKALEDYEFTLRVAEKYPFVYVDEELTTAFMLKESVGKQDAEKIFVQCYIMHQYAKELKRLGIKKEKFQAIKRNAIEWGCIKIFLNLMLNTMDEEYVRYVKEIIENV